MAGFFDVVKAIFFPAVIAAALYLLLAYLIVPLYRRHRERYSQYLPLGTITERTSSLRSRIGNALTNFILPSSMRWRRDVVVDGRRGSGSGDDLAFGEEEGESMIGFDVNRLPRGRDERGGRVEIDTQRRLSRDLEEGFKDDSEEEGSVDERRR
ncbi:hypothetical protein LTR85_003770 [Meristemomyces frigidus]|nr:hypothetical protein LTR85_003770 [Meristemomyces frigidus]